MDSFVVAKFGGTSMGDAHAMKKSAKIVCQNPKIKLVVVSATAGTTNQLLDLYENAVAGKSIEVAETMAQIITKHNAIAKDLDVSQEEMLSLNSLYSEIKETLEKLKQPARVTEMNKALQHLDHLLSMGEMLSAFLFTILLQKEKSDASYFDIRRIMITDDHFGKAEPTISEVARQSQLHLLPWIYAHAVTVVQGFVGATSSGLTTTLGRGGSDYTAALLAESLAESVKIEAVQIWTDVPGIMTMDPNVVVQAKVIANISFDEAAELANFGAKVLHPATLWPAVRKNIRVFVGSTFQPELGGTWILPELDETPTVRALALRKHQTLITVTSLRMLNAQGFLAKLFNVLASYHLSVDLVTTSEVSVALTIDRASNSSSGKGIYQFPNLLQELQEFCDVKIEENLTLVAIIGNGLTQVSGVGAKTFNSISDHNIRLLCHGASSHNICFLVKQEEAVKIVNRLHQEWVSQM